MVGFGTRIVGGEVNLVIVKLGGKTTAVVAIVMSRFQRFIGIYFSSAPLREILRLKDRRNNYYLGCIAFSVSSSV